MGYTSRKSLTTLARRAQRNVDPALKQVADDGGKLMVEKVQENTPVDTRVLRNSIRKRPVRLTTWRGAPTYESGAYTEVEYGPHVEHGTGLWGPKNAKYRIEPKDPNGVLAFFVKGSPSGIASGAGSTSEGTLVFARYVMHPGSPGQHMFAIGVAFVEASFDEVAQRGLNTWATRTERG